MIAATDRLWYAEPVPNPALNGTTLDPMFITREKLPRPSEPLVGTVATPASITTEDGTVWYTVDGRWVEGHVLNATALTRDGDVLILFGDDLFGVGRLISASGGTARVADVVRSDGFSFPVGMPVRVSRWVPAASWARELMPYPGEAQDTTDLRVRAAKWKFKRRRAEAVVWREAKDRDWTEDLDRVKLEGLPLGTPAWHPLIGGMVTTLHAVPAEAATDYQTSQLDSIKSRSLNQGAVPQARLTVHVEVLGNQAYDPDEHLSHTEATSIIKHRVNDYSLTLGEYSTSPVLTTLTDPAA